MCQPLNFFVGQRETIALLLWHVFNLYLLAVILRRCVHHADFLRPEVTTHDSRLAFQQRRFMHVELVRVYRALHHHFTQAEGGSDKHHLVKTGFGIDSEHHAGRRQVRANHALHAGRQSHAAVIVTLMHAVRDGTVVKQ
ncbi:hypothetical protein D3C80_1765790 [compost metagenome]